MHRTQTTTACLADQIQDTIHPLDGVHQIVWVVRWRAVGRRFSAAAARAFGFGEGVVLMGEVNNINLHNPSSAEIPFWRREAGHRLAPHPLCSVRAGGPVGMRLGRRGAEGEIARGSIQFVLVCHLPRYQKYLVQGQDLDLRLV